MNTADNVRLLETISFFYEQENVSGKRLPIHDVTALLA